MITEDTAIVFPNNVQSVMVERFQTLDPDMTLFKRPLRSSDPSESVGVFPINWQPDEDSYEIEGRTGASEPKLQMYFFGVQAFVKDADRERGLIVHSILAKMLRAMLYRDATLAVSLLALSVEMFDSIETTKRFGIRTQRFISNELPNEWLNLSILEFWLETETR
jgi:hypothetical protein